MKMLTVHFVLLISCFCSLGSENCLDNIEQSLSRLSHTPEKQKIYLGSVFDDFEYSKNIWNLFGFFNHFQGILYEPELDRFILTGGDRWYLKAHLIFINNINGKYIFTKKLEINSNPKNWHPGAPVKYKDTYIIPIEEFWLDRKSEILITNFKKQRTLDGIPIATGAVSLYEFDGKDFLIGFDMYGTNFYEIKNDEFPSLKVAHKSKDVTFNGSNSVVINQCDKKKFIISFGNSNSLAPIISGKDFIKLYSFEPSQYKAQLLKVFDIDCKSMCHFRGAVNAQIVDKKLEIIATETNKSRSRDFLYLLSFKER